MLRTPRLKEWLLRLFMLLAYSARTSVIYCQVWAWLGGDQLVDRISSENYPGGRSGAATWHDVNTNLTWMFGGRGFSQIPLGKPRFLDDLWLFDPREKRMDNDSYFVNILPEVSAQSKGKDFDRTVDLWPSGRQHACICGIQDKLILFGGMGEGDTVLDDLWMYNGRSKNWTQVLKEGPSARGHPAFWCFGSFMYLFGGLGDKRVVLSDMWKLNLLSLEWTLLHGTYADGEPLRQVYRPEGRNGAVTWVSREALYMYGGNTAIFFSYSLQMTKGLSSDMWRYLPCNSTWESVKNLMDKNQRGVHNGAGSYSVSNMPGSRLGAGSWVDAFGGLWLFGGAGVDTRSEKINLHAQVLSDVWRFNTRSKAWAFIGGSEEGGMAGVYKPMGEEREDALPGSRTEMMVFPGSEGKAYIFGGVGHDGRHLDGYLNDLWRIDISTILSGQYAVSAISLLLFLGVCISLLVISMLIGPWGKHLGNRQPCHRGSVSSGYRYRQVETSHGADDQRQPFLLEENHNETSVT